MGNYESAESPYTAPSHPSQQHKVAETTMSESGNVPEEPVLPKRIRKMLMPPPSPSSLSTVAASLDSSKYRLQILC